MNVVLAVIGLTVLSRIRHIAHIEAIVCNVFIFGIRHIVVDHGVNGFLIAQSENAGKLIVCYRIGALVSHNLEITLSFSLNQFFTAKRSSCAVQVKAGKDLCDLSRGSNTVNQVN